MSPPVCGVVVFNYPEFIIQYPQFAPQADGRGMTQPVAQSFFNRVVDGGLVDNTPQSPITDLFQRTILLNLAVAHLAYLGGVLNPSQANTVGRVASATQGSVSVSLDYDAKGGLGAAFWNQTSYGAQFYMMTLSFRTAFYVPPPLPLPTIPGGAFFGRRRW